MTPILSVFLLSYPALYEFTLGPLNRTFITLFDEFTTADGVPISFRDPGFDELIPSQFKNLSLTKVVFAGDNSLRYESLKELSEWTQRVEGASLVLSPLSYLSCQTIPDIDSVEDKKSFEKCYLKILNHYLPRKVINMFFDMLGKQNYMINSAQIVKIILLSQNEDFALPEMAGRSLRLVSRVTSKAENVGADFVSYFASLNGRKSSVQWLSWLLVSTQNLFILVYFFRVYLSICNNHKIRFSFGLLLGWLNGVFISAFASLVLVSRFGVTSNWLDSSDPTNSILLRYYLLCVLILSSRTLLRTINDLAGDSSFGEPESLHKRLMKFYLGFNSSVQNSSGVYYVSSFIRRVLLLDSHRHMVPIPNTTIILSINIAGLSAMMGVCACISRLVLDHAAWVSFCLVARDCIILTASTLFIDHFLQLTYMVTIIVIDLHRIDLTDVLAKAKAEDDIDFSTLHEVNPISARLLAGDGIAKSTWAKSLGTYLLKVSPHSPRLLWQKIVPAICICSSIVICVQIHLTEKLESLSSKASGIFERSIVSSNGGDTFYYVELVAVITLIVVVSELTFTLAFSERQKQNLDSVVIADKLDMILSDLSNVGEAQKFETITLAEDHPSEKLALFANPKAPILLSTDLGHRVSLWSSLCQTKDPMMDVISTVFETKSQVESTCEFWPVNHAEVSNEGDYIVLINYRNCRIKCFSRNARKLSGGTKRGSSSSLNTMHGNYPPPLLSQNLQSNSLQKEGSGREYEEYFNREEFVMILESGEMITISCDSVKMKVYNLLAEIFSDNFSELRILSAKFLTTSRVNDRVLCTVSNDEVVVGSAVNNIWRFSKLEVNNFYTSNSSVTFAPPLMSRGTWAAPPGNFESKSLGEIGERHTEQDITGSPRFALMNESTIVTIDFVGMFVRVRDLQAELIDISTGTVVRLFHIGTFKPGSFRVSHSEPTHCKFCGCVSFETMSLLYEDLYEKTLIVHTFRLESKRSRNNICLRVERDPLEIRCLGFDSVVETQHWFNDIELWELTDMNIVMGVKKSTSAGADDTSKSTVKNDDFSGDGGLSSLRNRKRFADTKRSEKSRISGEQWQGFIVTVSDGRLLDYKIPMNEPEKRDSYCIRPNLIIKFGFKAVAVAFGPIIKILYLGSDKLVESDLYYSGSASTIGPLLKPGTEGSKPSNELLFINKRRRMVERRFARTKG
ncbi:hypothetical protein OXX69_000495 [Metschnikowia pulcherrima]